MSNTLRNSQSITLSIPNGHSVAISPIDGTAYAVITAGEGRGTVLIDNTSTGGTFGPYHSGAVILLTAGPAESLIEFDVGLSVASVLAVAAHNESPSVIAKAISYLRGLLSK